jgi:hypothetical protein
MTSLNRVKLFEAEQAYATANTSSFLMRKLRADPVVKNLRAIFGSPALLNAVKAALRKRPQTLTDAVRPYAYLVALSFDSDASYLRDAAKLRAPHAEWYQSIARALVELQIPVRYTTVNVPVQINKNVPDTAVSSVFSSRSTEDVQ